MQILFQIRYYFRKYTSFPLSASPIRQKILINWGVSKGNIHSISLISTASLFPFPVRSLEQFCDVCICSKTLSNGLLIPQDYLSWSFSGENNNLINFFLRVQEGNGALFLFAYSYGRRLSSRDYVNLGKSVFE